MGVKSVAQTSSNNRDATSLSDDNRISSSASQSAIFSNDTNTTAELTEGSNVKPWNPGQQRFAGIKKRKTDWKAIKVKVPTIPEGFTTNNRSPSITKPLSIVEFFRLQYQEQMFVNSIESIEERVKELQEKQDNLRQQLGKHRKEKPSIFKQVKRKKYYEEKENLKDELSKVRKARWQAELDFMFEKNKGRGINEIAEKVGSDYIRKLIKKYKKHNTNQYYLDQHYITLEGLLKRANPTYQDKRVLLKWEINQVETLMEGSITKKDKKALKVILVGLQKEKKQSEKDFDPKSDRYIQKWRKARSETPHSIIDTTITTQRNHMSHSITH